MSGFRPGQVVTVFRSRLLEEPDPRYEPLNARLLARAAELGGLVEAKFFVADDGERVTLVTFEDDASHERWARDAAHLAAQTFGRERVYATYSIQICDCRRATSFEAPS